MSRNARTADAGDCDTQQSVVRRVDHVAWNYMIDVCPSLGINAKTGEGMVALGNNSSVALLDIIHGFDRHLLILMHLNSGDIVIVQHESHHKAVTTKLDQKDIGTYESCAILHTPQYGSTGHKDVVRCIYHDVKVCGSSKVAEALLIGLLGSIHFSSGRACSLAVYTVVRETVFCQDGLCLRRDSVVIRRMAMSNTQRV